MRLGIQFAAVSLISAGAISCQEQLPTDKSVPIELSPVTGEEDTKSVADSGKLPSTYVITASAHLTGGGNDKDYFISHQFVHEKGFWKGVPTVYWPFSGGLDMLCLATEQEGTDLKTLCKWGHPDASKTVSVEIPEGKNLDSEILYGATDLKRGQHTSPLAMRHSQALLRFRVTSNAADLVRIDRIEVENVYPAGTLTVHNYGTLCHEWSFRGYARRSLVMVPGSVDVELGNSTEVIDLLLPEQESGKIRITYRRRDYVTDPWDTAPVVKTVTYDPQVESWWSGRMYEYRMQFTLTQIVFSMELKPWDSRSTTVTTLQ